MKTIRVEFPRIWERVYNPDFNYGEYAIIRSQAGLNSIAIQQMKLLMADHGVEKLEDRKK